MQSYSIVHFLRRCQHQLPSGEPAKRDRREAMALLSGGFWVSGLFLCCGGGHQRASLSAGAGQEHRDESEDRALSVAYRHGLARWRPCSTSFTFSNSLVLSRKVIRPLRGAAPPEFGWCARCTSESEEVSWQNAQETEDRSLPSKVASGVVRSSRSWASSLSALRQARSLVPDFRTLCMES